MKSKQQILAWRFAKIERQAQLVAGVGLPEQRMTLNAPIAQRIALARLLNLDHLCAEIRQLQRHHVAGHQTR